MSSYLLNNQITNGAYVVFNEYTYYHKHGRIRQYNATVIHCIDYL